MLDWDYEEDQQTTEPIKSTQTKSVPDVKNSAVNGRAHQVSPSETPPPSKRANAFNQPPARATVAKKKEAPVAQQAQVPVQPGRVQVDDKRMINARADLNQLIPIKYGWAWTKYLQGCANHWQPEEIRMNEDKVLWDQLDTNNPRRITDHERLVIKRSLGFFSTADSLVANNIIFAIYRHITNPECRQYLIHQAAEEAIHTHSYLHIIQSLGLDEGELFNMYREIPSVQRKSEWAIRYTRELNDPDFTTGTTETDRAFLLNLIAFYCVLEGIFFYCGFAQLLAFHTQNKLMNMVKQIIYIMRDESLHVSFGIDCINQIVNENPHLWDLDTQAEVSRMIEEGTDLEIEYAVDTMPAGILNLNADSMTRYLKYVANRRLQQLGLDQIYKHATESPFKWLNPLLSSARESNFFETRVTSYQSGGSVDWN